MQKEQSIFKLPKKAFNHEWHIDECLRNRKNHAKIFKIAPSVSRKGTNLWAAQGGKLELNNGAKSRVTIIFQKKIYIIFSSERIDLSF